MALGYCWQNVTSFWLFPVPVTRTNLLGSQFEGPCDFDEVTPRECSVACATLERFNSMLEWAIVCETSLPHTLHALADFRFAGRLGTSNCEYMLQAFQKPTQCLSVPRAMEKEGPTQSLMCHWVFLGYLQRSWNRSGHRYRLSQGQRKLF